MTVGIPVLRYAKEMYLKATLQVWGRIKVAISLVSQDVENLDLLRAGQTHHSFPKLTLVGDIRVNIAFVLE